MKKNFFIAIVVITLCFFNIAFATDANDNYFYYENESGELVKSGEYELNNDSVLIEDLEDYNDLLDSEDQYESQQNELKEAFEAQKKELAKITEAEKDKKLVITKILSDIKTEYTTDYYYTYIMKYQLVNVKNEDGKETAGVAILAYDVADNQNIKPLKAGDTVYGYIEYASSEDEAYNMVNHGLKDSEIAFVSVSSQDRSLGVILLTIFTILLLLLYAGKNGAKILIPVFVAIDLLFIVLIPELEIGKNLIWLTTLIALELIILITVLKNGLNRKTFVSIISSIIVVTLISVLAYLFATSNNLIGKGIIDEENYDLLTNVYYIDSIFKSTIDTANIFIAMLILITSIITATISSKLVEFSEKYAGTKDMINSIIEESKTVISEYPMIISGIFLVMYIPQFMVMAYNHTSFVNIINSESLVTHLALLLLSIISGLIISPITAIISNLLMGDVELKRIEE